MRPLDNRKLDAFFNYAEELQPTQDVCFVKTTAGYHVSDPIYLMENAINVQQCILLCLKLNLCLSANFVQIAESQGICTLHSSNPYVLNLEIHSINFEFSCQEKPHIITQFANQLPLPTMCGVAMRKTERDRDLILFQSRGKRIVGGFETNFYSQPWHIWVIENGRHVCGASLIARRSADKSSSWAISAAHCFVRLKLLRKIAPRLRDYTFVLGAQDNRVFTPHIITRKAKRIFWPAKYGNKREIDDVALIEFTEEVTFTMYILPICLPQVGLDYDRYLNLSTCYICGYGYTKDRFPFKHDQMSDRPDRMHCTTSAATRDYNSDLIIRDRSTKMDYRGSSQGDSGGGYVCKESEQSQTTLIGIISGQQIDTIDYNNGRTVYSYYSYSTFLPEYMNWVKSKIDGLADDDDDDVKTCKTCWH